MATHSNGMSAVQLEAQLGITYKTAWLLAQKLRRSMIDPQREPLEGVVEVDQAEIPFRADNSFFDPAKSGKILIAGAVEVIDRGTNQAKPRRKRAKYLDTRSGRIRLAAIPDNSAASIEAFVRANVKTGTTLLANFGVSDRRFRFKPAGGFRGNRQAVSVQIGTPLRMGFGPDFGEPPLRMHPILLWSAKASTLVIIIVSSDCCGRL